MDLDVENEEKEILSDGEDEADFDERKHNQLLDAISSLDGSKKKRFSQRTIFSKEISEFNFGKSGDDKKVKLFELVGTLKDSASHGSLKKQLRSVERRHKVLATPLPRHQKEKIERTVAYEKTSTDLGVWDPVVLENKKAEQLRFPLQQPSLMLQKTDAFVAKFKPRTPLELEVAALLKGSDDIHTKKKELTPAEEKALQTMSLEEARERRAELQKHRALLSYKEAKARWQKKIKSKRYHRVLRKERQKTEKKELEELEKTDPEAYLEKLKLLEKDRIEERMSLKYRGGSKYSKKQMIYAKYDDKARQSVQDMLQKSRELTHKNEVPSDSDAESEGGVSLDEEDAANMADSQKSAKDINPWLAKPSAPAVQYKKPEAVVSVGMSDNVNDNSDNDDDNKNYRSSVIGTEDVSLVSERSEGSRTKSESSTKDNMDVETLLSKFDKIEDKTVEVPNSDKSSQSKKKRKKNGKNEKQKKEKNITNSDDAEKVESDHEESLISEGLERKRTLEEIERQDYGEDPDNEKQKKSRKETDLMKGGKSNKMDSKEIYVDPKKLFKLETKMSRSTAPDVVSEEDEDMDPEERQRMTIAQAFADDDVIDEFSREKREVRERQQPKNISLVLPGWGDWGGEGIQPSKKKRKKFMIKTQPAQPRMDRKLGNVIISEEKDKAIAQHQVSNLPFPYTSVEQFEQSVQAPIGKMWVPETAFKRLIKPAVVTRLGKIISPIDKSQVFQNQNTTAKKGRPDKMLKKSQDHKNTRKRKHSK